MEKYVLWGGLFILGWLTIVGAILLLDRHLIPIYEWLVEKGISDFVIISLMGLPILLAGVLTLLVIVCIAGDVF